MSTFYIIGRSSLLLLLIAASVIRSQDSVSTESNESTSGSSESQPYPRKENANGLVDSVVKLIKPKYKPPMKPIMIGNRTLGINERIGLVRVIALMRIKEGYINQVGDLERIGDAYITEYEDESTMIEMRLGLSDLLFNSTIEAEVMGIRQNEVIVGSVDFFGVEFQVMSNATTGDRSIENVRVFDIRGLQLNLLGKRHNDFVRRIQNVQLRMGIDFVMNNNNLKRIVYAIVSHAASDSIRKIAGSM